ncbi:dihydrolipoamide acetyltransferase [Paenibacillus sp. TCA20]|uniref:dihydrolipoamide acetyltransferase family protein n=1 Tax=Paenibacillus sp. TCA20 TaxID=1499968 RepID=UPI0004D6BB55|nr:dihydrolipoamide acetyltransferase family protein [Paenibacillus sp. TCA20]GAK39934.1 dihydrolipoamide acetyltransferase [Paenibacillus sp. TCA20]
MAGQKKWIEIVMPQLAESLVSATIAKWLKKPGDPVEQYEPICEVITDKVNAEIPSTVEGIMGEIAAEEGKTVAVGELICRMEVHAAAGTGIVADSSTTESSSTAASESGHQEPDGSMRGRYSPAVQSLAAEHGLDLKDVPGTGMNGRVTRKDVLGYIQEGAHRNQHAGISNHVERESTQQEPNGRQQDLRPAADSTGYAAEQAMPVRHSGIHLSETPKIPKIEMEGFPQGRAEQYIDVTPVRNAIARNMRQSVSEIPHAWTMIEVDVTNLVTLRNKLKDEFKRSEGINLTYLSFLLKAVVNAIKDYPIMNSVWAVDKIIVKRDINIALAVGTEDSVMTPVIQRADTKNIAGLAHEIDDLARRTREGTLKLDDMQGGTFTVNNTGSFGSILSYPIINYPQAAILTFESIVKRPVVINDMIAVRSMANLCLSLDHRILDGVISGRFLQRVKENLESYSLETKLY